MDDTILIVSGTAAALSLGVCLCLPILFFAAAMDGGTFKTAYLLASVVWFVSAAVWLRRRDVELEKEQAVHASE